MRSNAAFAREQYTDEDRNREKLDQDWLLDDSGNLTHDVDRGAWWLARKGFPATAAQRQILDQLEKGKIEGQTALRQMQDSVTSR
jgi:hypothetical protein